MVIDCYHPLKDDEEATWDCSMIDEQGVDYTQTNKVVTDDGNYIIFYFKRDDINKGNVNRVTAEGSTPTRVKAKPAG